MIFNPATSATSAGPQLTAPRAFHTSIAIGGGKVLIAGGNSAPGQAEFELCTLDGSASSCVATGGSATTSRCHAAAALLSSSPARVVVAGGADCITGAPLSSWEIWDGTSADTAANPIASNMLNALSSPRAGLSATVVAEGVVLFAGGGSASAELFTVGGDASQSTVTPVGSMLALRDGHTATMLAAGSPACASGSCVLIAGGVKAGTGAPTWEIFDVASGTFGRPAGAAELVVPTRAQQGAALLADGRVLLAGGTSDGKTALASTEIFDPGALAFNTGLSLQAPSFAPAYAYLPNQDLLMLAGSQPAPELIAAP